MVTAGQIVVYGASGYIGKLICESLYERGFAFIVAGRNEEKLHKALSLVAERAQVEQIDARVVALEHTEKSLTALFSCAKVVINATGPFSETGELVVKSALTADCHYLDTTVEQAFVLDMKAKYCDAFAEKNLLLAPSCATMWSLGSLIAEVTLENSDIDSLEIAYNGEQRFPSIAASQSVMRMLVTPQFYLKNNELVAWQLARTFDVLVAGKAQVFKGSPWGGAVEPVWYADDKRVRNCKVYQCSDDHEAMGKITELVRQIIGDSKGDTCKSQAMAIEGAAQAIQLEPDKENSLLHRGVIHCAGLGSAASSSCTIHFHSPYAMTGELIAECSRLLVEGAPNAVGFSSIAAAFGHRELLKMLGDRGFLIVDEQ